MLGWDKGYLSSNYRAFGEDQMLQVSKDMGDHYLLNGEKKWITNGVFANSTERLEVYITVPSLSVQCPCIFPL